MSLKQTKALEKNHAVFISGVGWFVYMLSRYWSITATIIVKLEIVWWPEKVTALMM